MEDVTGYTEEEFKAIVALMGIGTLIPTVWVDSEPLTPQYRLKLVEAYRNALAHGYGEVKGWKR